MASLVPGYEYDIFISYRHKDNKGDHWVTEFVNALRTELEATFKEDISIYFDENPHDGLLETHDVDDSLKDKLKCLILIPIISQTYCDPKSFAWNNEFLVFKKLASEDSIGLKVKLGNGNVSSRVLPVRIHDLDLDDKTLLEKELGILRAVEFTYREPGVNRPLRSMDIKNENLNKTDYQNQVNKVANAVKELVYGISGKHAHATVGIGKSEVVPVVRKRKIVTIAAALVLALSLGLTYIYKRDETQKRDEVTEILDRAEKYIDEFERFEDRRYLDNAGDAVKKALALDSMNERALYLMALVLEDADTSEYFIRKIFSINPESSYGLIARAGSNAEKMRFSKSIEDLEKVLAVEPENKEAIKVLSGVHWMAGDYVAAWKYAKRYEQVSGKGLHSSLSGIFLELGDFKEARNQLELKLRAEELSCNDLEAYQRIYLCEGNFEKLEQVTDSICKLTKCDKCPYWNLRAKMFAGKFTEADRHTQGALKNYGPIAWRLPAFVLDHVGKKDSARLLMDEEIKYDKKHLSDTAYRQALPLYSLSAISAMQGDYKESIKWLKQYADRGFEMGSEWYIVQDPLFDGLRKDPRYFPEFIQIVQRAQVQKMAVREKIRGIADGDQ